MKFDVWAPLADNGVQLCLGDQELAMRRGEDGWWSVEADAQPGDEYAFKLNGNLERPDPRSLAQPHGPHGRSAVVDLSDHQWRDGGWPGTDLRNGVLYELHVGTFTEAGTFDAAIEHLPHLASLGVTMIELMPVVCFPGERGWGYDGVSPYAVHSAYGGAAGLQRLVDAAHEHGLGVCLDVVYNHLGPSGNYLPVYGPYFTDRHHTPWGSAVNLDGPESDQVRRYLIDNAVMWLRDFHIDALRLDAVHALVDERAEHFLEELAAEIDHLSVEVGRPLWLIAESDRNDPATVTARGLGGSGGLGLHAQWADDVHHTWHVLLTGETQGYYADFADPGALAKIASTPFFHDGTWSSFRERHHGRPIDPEQTPGDRYVVSLQTHDQVGNRAAGDRLSQLVSPGRLACGAALMLTGPYIPMLFMGEEWGASTPWQYFTDHQEPELALAVSEGRQREFAEHGWSSQVPDPQEAGTREASVLNWGEVTAPEHAAVLDWYRTLIGLRRDIPDLGAHQLPGAAVTVDDGLIRVERGRYLVALNLSAQSRVVAGGRPVVAAFDASMDAGGEIVLDIDGVVILGPEV